MGRRQCWTDSGSVIGGWVRLSFVSAFRIRVLAVRCISDSGFGCQRIWGSRSGCALHSGFGFRLSRDFGFGFHSSRRSRVRVSAIGGIRARVLAIEGIPGSAFGHRGIQGSSPGHPGAKNGPRRLGHEPWIRGWTQSEPLFIWMDAIRTRDTRTAAIRTRNVWMGAVRTPKRAAEPSPHLGACRRANSEPQSVSSDQTRTQAASRDATRSPAASTAGIDSVSANPWARGEI